MIVEFLLVAFLAVAFAVFGFTLLSMLDTPPDVTFEWLNRGANWLRGVETPSLEESEDVVIDEVGGLTKSKFWAPRGRLILTNKRLIFKQWSRIIPRWGASADWTIIRLDHVVSFDLLSWLSLIRVLPTGGFFALGHLNGETYILDIYRLGKWRKGLRRINELPGAGLPSALVNLLQP